MCVCVCVWLLCLGMSKLTKCIAFAVSNCICNDCSEALIACQNALQLRHVDFRVEPSTVYEANRVERLMLTKASLIIFKCSQVESAACLVFWLVLQHWFRIAQFALACH